MVLSNATILDFSTLSRRPAVDVHIQANRVRRIVPTGAAIQLDAGQPRIDASGMYLIPGLVNTHCHTAMSLQRGAAEDCTLADWFNRRIWRFERSLRPQDVYWGTLLGAAEMLLAGVTCAADHYFHMDQAWKAYRASGMRADLAWAVFGVGEDWQRRWAQALEFSREYTRKDPRLTVSLGPHSPYICPEPFLRRTAEAAEELGLKLHIHVSEEPVQVERSLAEKGRTPVQVLDEAGILRPGTVLAHAAAATDADLQLIRERGAGVAHCAKTFLKFGLMHDLLPRALAQGVPVGLGTDGPASNNTLGIFEAARCAAFMAKSARADARTAQIGEVLPLCHRGGEILGLAGYGRLEEGSLADLVLLDPRTPAMMPEHDVFANILYSLGERSVHTVIVDGEVLVRDGRLVHLDLEELARKTAEIASRLIRSAGEEPMQVYR